MVEFKGRITEEQSKAIEYIFQNEKFKSRAEIVRLALDQYLKNKVIHIK